MESKRDKHLLVLLAMLVLFVLYWTDYSNYRYTNYISQYYDVGVEAASLYWHIHGLQYYTNPLQYLIFTNHLSLFELLLVPVFALYQQTITFLFIQNLALAATALAAYFVVRDLLPSRGVALAFAFAMLVSPGFIGVANYDFHLESFTLLFYLLSFYFYMRKRTDYFALSFVLLLSLLEVEPLQGGSLLAGLLTYELFYNSRNGKYDMERLRMVGIGALLFALFFLTYYLLSYYIPSTYANSSQAVLPIQQLKAYLPEQVNALLYPAARGPQLSSSFAYLGAFGVLFFIVSFGFASLAVPLVSLVLFAPWVIEVFVVHNFVFAWPYFQYYLYELAASLVSAILGLMLIKANGLPFLKKKIAWNLQTTGFVCGLTTITALTIFAVIVFLGAPARFLLNNAPNVNYTALNAGVGLIPSGANVMAQGPIAAHLFYVRNLEISSSETSGWFRPVGVRAYWFTPDYIITNNQLEDYGKVVNAAPFNQSNFSSEYTLYYNRSGTFIYKHN